MRVRGLVLVGQFEVAQLGPADRQLLLLGRQGIPRAEVVDVLLDDHVAAAGERGLLVADQDRVRGCRALRVLGAVDESEHVTLVKRAEAVHLVDDHAPARVAALSGAGRARSTGRSGEHGCGTAGRPGVAGGGVTRTARAPETDAARTDGRRPNSASHRTAPIPTTQVSSASGTRKPTDRLSPRDVGKHVRDVGLRSLVHGQHEEDRRLGRDAENRLGLGRGHGRANTTRTDCALDSGAYASAR